MSFELFTIKGFFDFVDERERIRLGKGSYITGDEILRRKRFCNISREHDRGTIILFDKIKNLSLNEKVLISFYYRTISSGNQLLNYVNPDLDSFKVYVRENEKIQFHRNYSFPYQFRYHNIGSYRNFLLLMFEREEDFLSMILGWNRKGFKPGCFELRDFVNSLHPVARTNSLFVFFQFLLDLANIKSDAIDRGSEIFWGAGSGAALKSISKNESLGREEVLRILKQKLDLITLEHALCEYNKYCSYVLGTKSLANRGTDYKSY